jgi:uncharacterized protein (TIGR03437 family)
MKAFFSLQVPAGITGQAVIQVHFNGASSNTLTTTASASAPGLFPDIQGSSAYPAAVPALSRPSRQFRE